VAARGARDGDRAVTTYEHVAVLPSIIVGLGIAQLLTSVHRVAEARARVRHYWLPLVWVVVLFVSQVEWWWAFYGMRNEPRWNFFYVLFVLLSPVTLFLASAFVLPEVERGERYDLREHYYANRGWFFALLAASPLLDGVRRAMHAGAVTDFGAASNLVSAALVGSLMFTTRPRWHGFVTVLVSALFGWFIVSAALELR
jgi:hypothetical protein